MKKPIKRNSPQPNDLPPWTIGFALRLIAVCFLTPLVLAVILVITVKLFPGLRTDVRGSFTETNLNVVAVLYTAFVTGYLVHQLKGRPNVWRDLGFRRFPVLTTIKYLVGYPFYYFGMALLLVGVVVGIAHLLGFSLDSEQVAPAQSERTFSWIYFFLGVLIAPVIEEIFFRGILMPAFARKYGWLKGGVYSSLIFSAAHGPAAPFIMIFSLYLSRMRYRTGSIIPGILLHMANNTFVILVVLR